MGRMVFDRDAGMFYVARRHIDVSPGDRRFVGDAVPEAFEWKKVGSLVSLGLLVFVPKESKPPAAQPEQRPLPVNPEPGPAAETVPPLAAGPRLGAEKKKAWK